MYNLPQGEEVNINYLNNAFDSMTTSYKIFCFKGIFDEVIKDNYEISYKSLVCNMIINAWYPILKYNLNFGKMDQLGTIIHKIQNNHKINIELDKNKLLVEIEKVIEKKDIDRLLKYVLARIIRPTFQDELKNIKTDYGQQSKIEELCMNNTECLYRIVSNKEVIIVNNKWFKYIRVNQGIISGWINYNLVDFLQRKNPNVPGIINKLEPEVKRDLEKAKKIFKRLVLSRKISDIYTEEAVSIDKYEEKDMISIDHFIPWSFVSHDMIWNLTPTVRSVNSSKNDNLPCWGDYFEGFIDQQYELFNYLVESGEDKLLEDYLIVFKDLDLPRLKKGDYDITKECFKEKMFNTLNPLYQIALNQGFGIWDNKSIKSKDIIQRIEQGNMYLEEMGHMT